MKIIICVILSILHDFGARKCPISEMLVNIFGLLRIIQNWRLRNDKAVFDITWQLLTAPQIVMCHI